jgi:hypothetical protein
MLRSRYLRPRLLGSPSLLFGRLEGGGCDVFLDGWSKCAFQDWAVECREVVSTGWTGPQRFLARPYKRESQLGHPTFSSEAKIVTSEYGGWFRYSEALRLSCWVLASLLPRGDPPDFPMEECGTLRCPPLPVFNRGGSCRCVCDRIAADACLS